MRILIMNEISKGIYRKFFNSAIWGVLGTAATYGSALLISIGVARILGIHDFGKFIILQTTINVTGIFAGLGLGATAGRYISTLRTTEKPRLSKILHITNTLIILFGAAILLIYILASSTIADRVFNEKSIHQNLLIISPAIFLLTIDNYLKNILLGFENGKRFAICSCSGAACTAPVVLGGAFFFGLEGTVYGLVIGSIFQIVLSYLQVKACLREENFQIRSTGSRAEVATVLRYAVPTLLSTAMVMPAHWLCQAILLNKSSTYAQTAILGVAMQWFYAISFLPNSIGRIALPIFSRMFNATDSETFSFLKLNMIINGLICFPMLILFWLLGENIATIYGQGFSGAAHTLMLAAIAATLLSIQSPLGFIFAASARMWESCAANLVWAAIYIAIPYFKNDVDAAIILHGLIIAYIGNFAAAFALLKIRK